MGEPQRTSRWVAIVTGAFSIAIALIYLILITALDFRGQMLPPPPEALGVVEVAFADSFVEVRQLYEVPILKIPLEMIPVDLSRSDA